MGRLTDDKKKDERKESSLCCQERKDGKRKTPRNTHTGGRQVPRGYAEDGGVRRRRAKKKDEADPC